MKVMPGAWRRVGFAAVCRGMFASVGAAAVVATIATVVPQVARAESNAIESITSTRQGDATYLRITMSKPPANPPAGFTIANPPRIALDFADTANDSGRSSYELSQGDVRKVNIVTAANRSRLVLSLKRQVGYKTEIEGRDVLVTLEPVPTAAATAAKPATYSFAKPEPQIGKVVHALRDIDFRRGADGAGRVLVELSDSNVGVDIRQQGQTIIVDFQNARLPDNLVRRLDVGDFGTPVRVVRSMQRPEGSRLVIEPNGLWEHNAYQSDNQFVLEVKPVKEDPTRLTQGSGDGYRGERLSLNFQSVDVRALLQVIADFTNLNIVTSDSVQGSLTLRLKDVPWDQALDIVMQSKGLDMRKNGNVLLIAPQEELAAKEKLDLEARQQIADIEPLRTETFQLNYQKAENLQKLLASENQRVLSKRGSVVIDQRTNKLFVQDIAARLEDVRKLINQIDIPVRQVLIEARIVEADDRFSRNLGVKLGYNDLRSTIYRTTSITDPVTGAATALNVPVYGAGSRVPGGYATVSGNLSGAADLSSQMGSGLDGLNAVGIGQATAIDNTNFVNLPAAAIGGAAPASFAISLFGSSLTRFLNLEVSALEADQRGKVVSSPRVLTADQGKAIIEQGTELPYQESTSSGATAVTFRKANLKLEVTPQITPEGNVILEVEVNRDAVGIQTSAGFAIDTRRVQTQVLVENGGTVVIGGIYEQIERNQTNKVPFLGDLPIIGNAFKNNSRTNDRTELLVFLTPRVVTDTALAR
ncbi:MAG: type IV pilus secretin PilQ [Burkholderiaceae bacterium]|nr:type IV pilus secretin PilQ [Burkholderiaceae bacterium]MEB2320079.1 type IV pilus secretin PilQ [Pseudomonadota bacterium]